MKIWACIVYCFIFVSLTSNAQQLVKTTRYLYKPVSLEASNERLEDVLQMLGKKGDFYFSYHSALIKKDSIVSLSVQDVPVKEVLDKVLQGKFEYRESSNYIILRPAFYKLSITPETINSGEKMYSISGYIVDEKTGEKIKDASVYEKRLLKSTLTDRNGFFALKFKGDYKAVTLTVSKENYRDTTVLFLSTLNISPEGYTEPDEGGWGVPGKEEKLGIGRWFVSSRQKIQSLNISGFFANSPFQASLTPGLSSHGMMSAQVVNKASLNVIGGYTAGVDGVELAGIFNINKGSVKYVQLAGISNLAGGSVTGVQLGGINNTVRGNVDGVQIGGVINTVVDSIAGVQVGGVINGVLKGIRGTQIAGVINYAHRTSNGVQVAGTLNIINGDFNGAQIAGTANFTRYNLKGAQVGILNYSKNLKGIQVGVFNIADTSSGYSIGLFNWVNKGYHKISLSSNEVLDANLSIKTGNSKLYTNYTLGASLQDNRKAYAAGIGFGHDFIFSNRLSISAELASKYLYLGNIKDVHLLHKAETNFQVKLYKPFSIFIGPAYTLYYRDISGKGEQRPGYKTTITPKNHKRYSERRSGWLGWNIGVTVF